MRNIFRTLAALCLAAGLAACGGAGMDHRHPPGIPPQFGDARPHPWFGRAPAHYAVHGIDVSRWQGDIDWWRVAANGVSFAFIKATEGGDRVDEMFRDHWRGAARAGVRRGAYHFFYHCRPAIEQAQWFIRHVPRTPGMLPPVLDMEWTPFSPTCTIRRPPEDIRRDAAIFLRAVTAHYGQPPILYTSIDFFEDNQMWRVEGADFWLRAVAKHPADLYDGHPWTFWQYTSTGLVPGIPGKVDINVFAGSEKNWHEWLAARVH